LGFTGFAGEATTACAEAAFFLLIRDFQYKAMSSVDSETDSSCLAELTGVTADSAAIGATAARLDFGAATGFAGETIGTVTRSG